MIKIICAARYYPVVDKKLHYITWACQGYAKDTIVRNCDWLDDAGADRLLADINRENETRTLYPRINITILPNVSEPEEDIYRHFNAALDTDRRIREEAGTEIETVFDMRSYQYRPYNPRSGPMCFPDERGLNGNWNPEYVWMIKTKADSILLLQDEKDNNSLCRYHETDETNHRFRIFEVPVRSLSEMKEDMAAFGRTLEESGCPTAYSEFSSYYEYAFPGELNDFFSSYCKQSGKDVRFLGFNRDELIHMDTIILNMHREKLDWPVDTHLAAFCVGIWTLAAADIAVYSFFHHRSAEWEADTHYPKFTGWNYYATEPNYIFQLAEKQHPGVIDEIKKLTEEIGGLLVKNTAADIAGLLHLNRGEFMKLKDFLDSWMKMPPDEGQEYDVKCFLR